MKDDTTVEFRSSLIEDNTPRIWPDRIVFKPEDFDLPLPKRVVRLGLIITILTIRTKLTRQLKAFKIATPPGSRLLGLTEFLYSPKDQERTFKPIIADMWKEWLNACDQKRYMKARWIRIRYTWAFVQAMGIHVGVSLVKKIFDAWNAGV